MAVPWYEMIMVARPMVLIMTKVVTVACFGLDVS